MKKLASIALALILVASFCACSSKSPNTKDPGASGTTTFDYEKINKNISGLTYTENSQSIPLVQNQTKASSSDLKKIYGIDTNLLEDYYISSTNTGNDPSVYMILKPKAGKTEEVKEQANNYFNLRMANWSVSSSQYNMIKNRMLNEYNGYLIYIVSKDNQLIYNTIINN